MSKITQAAEGKNCTARIPRLCNFDITTTAWAHLNSVRWGSGKAEKSPDICGLFACNDCHDAIDGRRKKDKDGQALDPEFVRLCAYEGHMESIYILTKEGILTTK